MLKTRRAISGIYKITKNLTFWRYYTEYSTSIYLNDVNHTNEDLAALLLNIAYYWQLVNLNDEKANYPAIDLGDKKNGIGVSITSTNSSAYIHEKIQTNIKHRVFDTFPNHYFLITTKKKGYSTSFDTQGKYLFDKDKQIIDSNDLLEEIKKLPLVKQEEVLSILEKYVPKFTRNFIEDITPQDIATILSEFSAQNPVLTNDINTELKRIQRTDFPEKNKINKLSEEYIKLIQEHSLPFFKQFEDFLGKFENNSLKNIYLNTASDLQQIVFLKRNDFETFDDVFIAIEETCKTKVPSLVKDRRTLKILLHFMYFQCDIGENKK
jgi:hypothetical protein